MKTQDCSHFIVWSHWYIAINMFLKFDKDGTEINVLITQIWKDELIHWDPLLYGNLSAIQFYPTEVWRPDILVYNR